MKINWNILYAICLCFLFACGGDDDDDDNDDSTGSDLADAEFTFGQTDQAIDQTVIDNITSTANTTSDPNALQIAAQLNVANAMSVWLGFFSVSPDADEVAEISGGCSGNNSLTYSWTTESSGVTTTVAYQICETSEKYIYEVFWSIDGGDFQKIISAEQYKGDLQKGRMEIFAVDLSGSAVGSTAAVFYVWEESSDGTFNFNVNSELLEFVLDIIVNSDNSGSMVWQIDGELFYEATWNETGTSGTFTSYLDGEVFEEGNWPG